MLTSAHADAVQLLLSCQPQVPGSLPGNRKNKATGAQEKKRLQLDWAKHVGKSGEDRQERAVVSYIMKRSSRICKTLRTSQCFTILFRLEASASGGTWEPPGVGESICKIECQANWSRTSRGGRPGVGVFKRLSRLFRCTRGLRDTFLGPAGTLYSALKQPLNREISTNLN